MTQTAIEMLKTALDMEDKGRLFYEKAMKSCENPVGKEIFTILKNDEDVHTLRIKVIYNQLTQGKTWNADWKNVQDAHADLRIIFRDLATKHGNKISANTNDVDALNIGIEFEMKAVGFYTEALARATDNLERDFIQQMIDEEKNHHDTLTDMKLYLVDPAAWFMEQEHSTMDGA